RLGKLHLEDIRNDCPPFYQIAAEYLNHVEKTKSPRLFELEFTDYNKHLHPFLGSLPADRISEEVLQEYQQKKKSDGYANRSVNLHVGLVRKIINFAKTKKYLRETFKINYPMLEESKKQHAFLSFEEFNALKQNLTYDLTTKRVIVGRQTGLRPGELAHLAWDDVNLEMKTITVKSKPDVGWIIKDKHERVIPLGKVSHKILKELFNKRKGRWVFSSSDKPVKSIRRALNTAAKNAGISKRVTPNMLRHTAATHLLAKGANLKSVQEILGHAHIETTERYLHGMEDHVRSAVEALDDTAGKLPKTTGKKDDTGKGKRQKK
ncbi:MAG TPA: site-specific integrase, partial [Nitrospirota bacterium]|nr:site-specific integrase [Nitrospirota bacterium]